MIVWWFLGVENEKNKLSEQLDQVNAELQACKEGNNVTVIVCYNLDGPIIGIGSGGGGGQGAMAPPIICY